MGNSISNHLKKIEFVTHHFRISRFFHHGMSGQNAKFQSNAVCSFGFMARQRLPLWNRVRWAKTPFCQAVFHKNYNILKIRCHISLKI